MDPMNQPEEKADIDGLYGEAGEVRAVESGGSPADIREEVDERIVERAALSLQVDEPLRVEDECFQGVRRHGRCDGQVAEIILVEPEG